VLALTDTQLALLCIKATAFRANHRGRWLRKIARAVDPTPNALRCRRARQRRNNGTAYYRLALAQVEIEELLVREGLLAPGQEYTRAQVEAALAEFITRLCAFDMHVEPEAGNGL
jgi:hypothetical protein